MLKIILNFNVSGEQYSIIQKYYCYLLFCLKWLHWVSFEPIFKFRWISVFSNEICFGI